MYSVEELEEIIESYRKLKCIGKGTYGSVYLLDKFTVLKKQELFENFNGMTSLNSMIIKEACALTQFEHPYMIKGKNFKINNNIITFEMEKCLNLRKWLDKNKNIKFNLLPQLVSQLIELLFYYEKINKVHGDLSINNITVDKNNNIKVIDYGSFMCNPKITEPSFCTHCFCAPELQQINGRTVFNKTCKTDIFSLGMVIKYIITGHYDDEETIKEYEINKYDEYNSCHTLFTYLLDKDFILLWRQMLKINPNKRISAKELYNSSYFKNIRELYSDNDITLLPISPAIISFKNKLLLKKFKNIKFHDINHKMRKILISWMYEVCKSFKTIQCLGLSVHILDLYLSKNTKLHRNDLQCLGCVCLSLAITILIGRDVLIDDFVYISKKCFTNEEMKTITENVLLLLNYNLYYYTFDQQLDNPDYLIITYMCYDKNNTGKTNKELISIYNDLLRSPSIISKWLTKMKLNKYLS